MVLLRARALAIMQNNCPARLRLRLALPFRLPLSRLPGASPVHAVKCFSVGQAIGLKIPLSIWLRANQVIE